MSDSGNDLDTAINQCFAAFDEEFKSTFSRFYVTSLSEIHAAAHKTTPEELGDIEAVLPSLSKTDKPKGDPQVNKKKKKGGMQQMSPKLPLDGSLFYKGEQVKPEKANSALTEALKAALTREKVEVHVQDWGVANMDVEPFVFVQICATLGDFEAITFRSLNDFNALHELLNKPDVRTQSGNRPKKVGMPPNLRALERAALSSKPLKSKASRFDCICRKKTGLDQPHPHVHTSDSDSTLPSGVTKNSVVSVGTTFNPSCESAPAPVAQNDSAFGNAGSKPEKEKKSKKDKKSKRSDKPHRDTALKRAAVQKLQIGNRTVPVWSAPQPNCHCTCPYCCWGEAAAEVLGAKLHSYLLALCEHCYTEQLIHWLGFDLSFVYLVSFTHEQRGFISVPAVAAEALRKLYARTVADSDAAAVVPAFSNLWQASLFFNTPEEGLTDWVVSELIRARMTRSAGEAKGAKRLPDPDGRLFQEWLPGVSPLRTLTKDQLKARELAKAALIERVKPMAQSHYHDIAEAYNSFLTAHPPSQAEVEHFFEPFSSGLTNEVIGKCLDGGALDGMQCLTKIVCALLEKHVITRSVMEPLANIDSQLNQFIVESLYESSKNMDADFVNGRRSLAIATLTGTRYVVSSTIAASAYSFANDIASMIMDRKEELKSLAVSDNTNIAAGLACIPTLIRAVMHVILSEAPSSFITELSSYMVSVEQAPASSYKSATTNQKEALAKKWQRLRQILCAVSWRAGYLLEKSLVAQYVQQTALLKGAETQSRRSDPTVPSDEDASKKGKKGKDDSDAPGIASTHPYLLDFELDGVKKSLRALSETSAAGYWNTVLQFSDALDACIAGAHDEGQDRITPVQWKSFVHQSMRTAFESSFARMKAQYCNIATEMLIQFVCDIVSRNAIGESVRKNEGFSKVASDATSANGDLANSLQIGAAVDSVASQTMKASVAGVMNEWKEAALDRYHIVSETVSRAVSYQTTEKLTDSNDALDTRSLSVGSNTYSGSGSFTSDDDEAGSVHSSKGSASGSSKSGSSTGSSRYSSISGSRSRSGSGSSSGSRSGSVSGSGSRSGSASGSESGSRSGSGSASGSRSGSGSASRSGSASGSASGSSSSSSSHSSKSSEKPAEESENTASEMSEIVPFDRL